MGGDAFVTDVGSAKADVVAAGDLGLPSAGAPLGRAPESGSGGSREGEKDEATPSALPSYIEEMERKAIEKALQDSRYNKTKAAAALGITFRALRYKLKKLGID